MFIGKDGKELSLEEYKAFKEKTLAPHPIVKERLTTDLLYFTQFMTGILMSETQKNCLANKNVGMATTNKNKENTAMYTETDRQRDHLFSRAVTVYNKKSSGARKTFRLTQDDRPATFKDLQERLASGKFTIDEKNVAKRSYDPLDYVVWRDPSVKEDQEGFDAFSKELAKEYRKVQDDIMILDPKEGLEALRKFEEYTVQ